MIYFAARRLFNQKNMKQFLNPQYIDISECPYPISSKSAQNGISIEKFPRGNLKAKGKQ